MAISMIPPEGAAAFISAAGWDNADIVPLAGDASFRRYFRVVRGEHSAVLMDAPPPHEDPRPFINIAEHLTAQGFSAPEILARDLEQGLVLIEDFGSERMREVIEQFPGQERAIYEGVVDLLVDLHTKPAAPIRLYDRNEYQRETGLLTEWYCPEVGLDDVDSQGFIAAWDAVLATVLEQQNPPVTVLRDYHAENIMLVGERSGHARWGLLDFQDALAGHPAYDLVSVLEDARRDVPEQLEAAMLDRYCAASGAGQAFRDAYWVLGAQRNTKILGIFTRLARRDGKTHYLGYQPRMWGLLERDLAHAALGPVKDWFDANIPADKRAAFWEASAA